MIFELGDYTIQVKPEANKTYYANEQTIYDSDPNDDTHNFELAVTGISQEVQKLFSAMGADIKKPVEMYVSYEHNSQLVYEGYYHICGEIINGTSPWEKTESSSTATLNEDMMYSVGNSFKCGFSTDCTLLYDEFPRPCFQMEVLFTLPRVYPHL